MKLIERTEQLLGQAVRDFSRMGDRFEVPYQSTRVIVHPIDWSPGRTLLRVIAPVVLGVKGTAELYQRLSDLNNTTIFGKFYFMDETVWIEHNLLGETLSWEEFRAVLASVAHNADHLDEALMTEFGGHRWSDHD
ncbi:MAG: T3SS (YopN, CesT) and YbjN peptide-binding chaperone 1 [Planctomycetota bacterium]